MKKFMLLFALFSSVIGFSQSEVPYILLPVKFSCQKSMNQHGLTDLAKSYFVSKGFQVYIENEELPNDLKKNRCLAYFADVLQDNTLFKTILKVELKSCDFHLIASSDEGISREKDFRTAYTQAFREAVVGFEIPKNNSTQLNDAQPESNIITKEPVEILNENNKNQMLFAQPTSIGYQLVDATPKIIFKLTKTNMPDYFMAVRENVNGVVYKKDNHWFFDYYVNEVLKTEKLSIKF